MAANIILVSLAALTLVSIDLAQVQQQPKIAKIGWLSTRPASGPSAAIEVIRRELRELGYLEGKNIDSCIDTPRVSSTGSPDWLTS